MYIAERWMAVKKKKNIIQKKNKDIPVYYCIYFQKRPKSQG